MFLREACRFHFTCSFYQSPGGLISILDCKDIKIRLSAYQPGKNKNNNVLQLQEFCLKLLHNKKTIWQIKVLPLISYLCPGTNGHPFKIVKY
jgi:hypothetical protein